MSGRTSDKRPPEIEIEIEIEIKIEKPRHNANVMDKHPKLDSSEPPQEPGQFHGIPHPFIWKISPVEGVLKWEIRLHDKLHMEERKSFPVAFLLAQNWTGAAITPTPKGHITAWNLKLSFWHFSPGNDKGNQASAIQWDGSKLKIEFCRTLSPP